MSKLFHHLEGNIPKKPKGEGMARQLWETACNIRKTIAKNQTALRIKQDSLFSAAHKTDSERRIASLQYIGMLVDERTLIDEMNVATMKCLTAGVRTKQICEKEYENRMRDLNRKQAMRCDGDVAISRDRDRILAEIDDILIEKSSNKVEMFSSLKLYFYNLLRSKQPGRDAPQVHFRKMLGRHYGVQKVVDGPVYCAITRTWARHEHRKAAHIVPYKLGYETMGHIFGGDGYGQMWSMGNGLMMDKYMEKEFDELNFCLLPKEHPGKPDEFQFVLMNEEIRDKKVLDEDGPTFGDFDLQFLFFIEGNDARPSKRFLYFHYWLCVFKAQKEMTKGWEMVRENTRMGRLWVTPGPYLRKAMVQRLGAELGDLLLPEHDAIVANNTFEGGELPDEAVDVSVKDVLSMLFLHEKGGGQEDEEDW